jgi:hypothetical protein
VAHYQASMDGRYETEAGGHGTIPTHGMGLAERVRTRLLMSKV